MDKTTLTAANVRGILGRLAEPNGEVTRLNDRLERVYTSRTGDEDQRYRLRAVAEGAQVDTPSGGEEGVIGTWDASCSPC